MRGGRDNAEEKVRREWRGATEPGSTAAMSFATASASSATCGGAPNAGGRGRATPACESSSLLVSPRVCSAPALRRQATPARRGPRLGGVRGGNGDGDDLGGMGTRMETWARWALCLVSREDGDVVGRLRKG